MPPGLVRLPDGRLVARGSKAERAYFAKTHNPDGTVKTKKVKVKPAPSFESNFDLQTPDGRTVNPVTDNPAYQAMHPEPPSTAKAPKKTDWRLVPGGGYVDIKSGKKVDLVQGDPKSIALARQVIANKGQYTGASVEEAKAYLRGITKAKKQQEHGFQSAKKAERERTRQESLARFRMKWAQERLDKQMSEMAEKEGSSIFGWNPKAHGSMGKWFARQAHDISEIPVGLGKMGATLGKDIGEDVFFGLQGKEQGRTTKFLMNTADAMLNNEGGLFTYVPDPLDKEDMQRFKDAWSGHTAMGALNVLPLVGAAGRLGEAGAIAGRITRAKPVRLHVPTEAEAAEAATWSPVGKNAARAQFTGGDVVITRDGAGKAVAIAHVDRSQPGHIIIHDISRRPGSAYVGAGEDLLNALKHEAAAEGKGIRSPEVADESAQGWHQRQGFKPDDADPLSSNTGHTLSAQEVHDWAIPTRAARHRLAMRETKRPGYLAGQGFDGGIAPRTISTIRATPAAKEAAREVIEPGSGATLNADLTSADIEGKFVVAHGAYERTVDGKGLAQDLEQYKADHESLLADTDNKVGIWHPEGGRVVLDISRLFDSADEALAFARQEGQEAVFDGTKFEDIPTGLDADAAGAIKQALKAANPIASAGIEALRPWSRSTIGRDIQKGYDNLSTRFGGEMFRFAPARRAARVFEKTTRKHKQQFASWLHRKETIIHKGIRDDPSRMEALIASLEAPMDMEPRVAVETKIKHLEMIENPTTRNLQQIALLKDALTEDWLESPRFADALEAAMDLSDQADAMAGEMMGFSDDLLDQRRNLVAETWAEAGLIHTAEDGGVPVTQGATTLDEVIENMGATFDHNQITQNTADGIVVTDPLPYTRSPDPATARPLDFVYRAISEEEWQNIKEQGHIRSNESMNLSPDEGTVFSKDNPSYYLPGKLASSPHGTYRGRIIKVAVEAGRGWRYDHDGYVKTSEPIPITDIKEVSPPLAGERGTRTMASGRETESMPDFQPTGQVLSSLEARGYFPHHSVLDPMTSTNPTTALPSGDTVGVPQMKGPAFARKKNEMIRYAQSTVDTRPQALSNTLRGRAAVQFKQSVRQWLYERGRPISSDVPEGSFFVRNPAAPATKIRGEVKGAVHEARESGDPSTIETGDPYTMSAKEWYRRNAAGDLPDEWALDLKNVRVVPGELVRTVLEDAKSQNSFTTVMGLINSLTRSAILHLPYGGTRYVARNSVQNMILLSLTHPSAYSKLVKDVVLTFKNDRELFDFIQTEAGSVQAGMGLPDTYRGRTKLQRFERMVNEGTDRNVGPVIVNFGLKNIGSKLGWLADEPYRVAAWMKYADEYGFKGPKGYRRLMHSQKPEHIQIKENIAQFVRDDMIDFDTLTPFERETLSRWTFIYPFVKGASKWPIIFARDYPVRAGIMSMIGAQAVREQIPGMPDSENEINTGEHKWAWLMPTDPMFQNVQSGYALLRGFRDGKIDLSAGMDFAAPWLRSAGKAGFGSGLTWDAAGKTFLPGYTTYANVKRGGGFRAQLGRAMGYKVEPYAFRQADREADKKKVLADWDLSGGGYNADEITTDFKTQQEYKDLKARADFAAKDLGRKLSKKEEARLMQAVILKYHPDADLYTDEELKAGHNFDDYIKYLEKTGWGNLTSLKRTASRARSDAKNG